MDKTIFDERKFNRYFLLVTFVLVLFAFFSLIKVFILQIIIATLMTILIYPLFRGILKLTKGRRNISALLCCAIVVIGILLPLIFISRLVIVQSVELYRTAGPQIDNIIQQGSAGIIGKIMDSFIGKWILAHNITIEWKPILISSLDFFGSALTNFINKSSRATLSVIFNMFVILFSLFYFLRDGEKLLVKIRELIPIREKYKDRIIARFYLMFNATIKGILFIAFLQSFLATMTLYFFGVKTWLLWGIVMFVFSVIPFLGTGAVLIPAGIIKIITGDFVSGIAIIIISFFFISLIDNFLRPILIGQRAGMHDLLVFFSTIGGIVSFGPAGFIIGPLIASIFLTILEIYKIEFQPSLREYPNENNSIK